MKVKLRFWSLLFVLGLAVFMFTGCGGSADSGSEETTELPNNTPDTYEMSRVLDGTWDVLDQEITIDTDFNGGTLNMYLVTSSLRFTDTEITGARGLSSITLHENWRMILESGDVRLYMGINPINIDNQGMSLVKSGADNWRCDLYDAYRTVINIEVLAENIIKLTEHRLALISGDTQGIEYDNTMTFRKR